MTLTDHCSPVVGLQMVAQAYPFVASKVLRRDTAGGAALLREIVFDPLTGAVRPTRLAALLNAALGFVAQGDAQGFVDLDAVPAEGASVQVCGSVVGVGLGCRAIQRVFVWLPRVHGLASAGRCITSLRQGCERSLQDVSLMRYTQATGSGS